jgi:TIR domain/AAA domain
VTDQKDFFISYNKADAKWAEWIAWQLEAIGLTTVVQAWDFLPGQNFVLRMQEAAEQAKRTIAVLSPDFLNAKFTQPEWAAAFAQDPTGVLGKLVPIRVRPCELAGLLPQIVHVDFVGKDESEARGLLLAVATNKRVKPNTAPDFPSFVQATQLSNPITEVKNFPKTTQKLSMKSVFIGQWDARFTYIDGEVYRERIEITNAGDNTLIGWIVPSWDNCPHTAAVDHLRPIRLRGELGGTHLFTGIWYLSNQREQHGAFQLQVSSDGDVLDGGWMRYSDKRNAIVSGRWDWTRAQPRSDLVVGIYGITGSGKTTLCAELVNLASARTFSESDILDWYMRKLEDRSFDDFRKESENGRMKIREKAFSLYFEKLKNSNGLTFGDAHYAFPTERLGSIDAPHHEAERGIQPVMPNAAWTIYDAIVYLDTPSNIVHSRLEKQTISTPKNYWTRNLSKVQLDYWRDYEKRKLEAECAARGRTYFSVLGDRSVRDVAVEIIDLIENISKNNY